MGRRGASGMSQRMNASGWAGLSGSVTYAVGFDVLLCDRLFGGCLEYADGFRGQSRRRRRICPPVIRR